jgi:hypothetical protein
MCKEQVRTTSRENPKKSKNDHAELNRNLE